MIMDIFIFVAIRQVPAPLMGDGTVCVQLMGLTLNIDGCSGSHIKKLLGRSDLLTYVWLDSESLWSSG